MLMKLVKKSVVWEIVCFFRDVYRCPSILNCGYKIRRMKHAYCILLGTPTFNNLGDHLIALAELNFLKKNFPNYKIIEIATPVYLRRKNVLKEIIPKDIPIFITGGGWLGSVWPDDEYRMQDMLKTFKEHSISIFPQTVYYDKNNPESAKILESANLCYEQCKDLKLFLRDYDSYVFSKKELRINEKNIYLFPDIALWYINKSRVANKPTKRFLICLREDRENIKKPQLYECINEFATQNGIDIKRVDTITKKCVPTWMRKQRVVNIIREFSNADVVITDRLHGMIISVIAGTKCIVFNNTTNKVYGVYKQWLINNKNICYLNDKVECSDFTFELKKIMENPIEEQYNSGKIFEKFNDMADVIRREDLWRNPKD